MKLPNPQEVVIDQGKIKDYLLSTHHADGSSKAHFFMRFGFSVTRWKILDSALRLHAQSGVVTSCVDSEYGIRLM